MSEHVDGEEEQLALLKPVIDQARLYIAKFARRPVPADVSELLEWLARESFRIGHEHAHSRTTMKAPYADDEFTPTR